MPKKRDKEYDEDKIADQVKGAEESNKPNPKAPKPKPSTKPNEGPDGDEEG